MRALPPPTVRELDLDEGFPAAARQAIEDGERALRDLRENTIERWISVGAACKALRNVALNRSSSNRPTGRRYSQVYAVLTHAWPELAKVDKATRANAIWLFDAWDERVKPWFETLPQNQRDRWTHPQTIRRQYEKRYPRLPSNMPAARKRRPPRTPREWNRRPLGERSRTDLEAIIVELMEQLADRDREIVELNEELNERDRTIAQLRDDVAWERARVRQLEGITIPPGAATVVRPDGETAAVVHAVTRESQEVPLPVRYGQPDFPAWAKLIMSRVDKLSPLELQWLRDDNAAHIHAYDSAFPGAGLALKGRITARIAELEQR